LEEPGETIRCSYSFDAEKICQEHGHHEKPATDTEAITAENDKKGDCIIEEWQKDDRNRGEEDERGVHDELRHEVSVGEEAEENPTQEVEDGDDGQECCRVHVKFERVNVRREEEEYVRNT
jgi:hypothetical protein